MAQPKFEDLVKAVQSVGSIFSLGDDLPLLGPGLLDLQNRFHAVEAFMKAHAPPAHPAPPHPAAPAQKA